MRRAATLCTVLVLGVAIGVWAAPAYRRAEWRHWLDVPDHPCQSIRQAALARDARPGSVTWESDRECRVSGGTWLDPYSGEILRDPGDLDVDHLIPLGKAHARGGWRWSKERKAEYANFLGYRRHLWTVRAHENRSKGDQGPEAWRPPRREAWCAYGEAWASVVVLWDLEVTAPERAALREMLGTC